MLLLFEWLHFALPVGEGCHRTKCVLLYLDLVNSTVRIIRERTSSSSKTPKRLAKVTTTLRTTSLSLYRLLKFKYLDPINSKIKLLPMKAVKIPRSRHRFAKSIPKGA